MMFQDVTFTLLNAYFQTLESNRRFDSGPSHFLLFERYLGIVGVLFLVVFRTEGDWVYAKVWGGVCFKLKVELGC